MTYSALSGLPHLLRSECKHQSFATSRLERDGDTRNKDKDARDVNNIVKIVRNILYKYFFLIKLNGEKFIGFQLKRVEHKNFIL